MRALGTTERELDHLKKHVSNKPRRNSWVDEKPISCSVVLTSQAASSSASPVKCRLVTCPRAGIEPTVTQHEAALASAPVGSRRSVLSFAA